MEFNKFSDLKVTKPDIDQISKDILDFVKRLDNASSSAEAIKVVYDNFKYNDDISSNIEIISIRNSINVKDKYYEELMDFLDEKLPLLSEQNNMFDLAMLKSKFRPELEKEFGSLLFKQIENSVRIFSPEIIPEMQEENKLVSQYGKLMGSALVNFRGEDYPTTKLLPFMTSTDRETRKESSKAFWSFFEKNDSTLGDIYNSLVQVRTKMAKKLGFDNFVQLGYYRLGRLDYNQKDVENYRNQVLKYIVPLSEKCFARQKERIGIADYKYFDEKLTFKSGNPVPVGTPDDLVKDAQEMYEEMSPVASKYFNFMKDHELFDLVAKDGKQPGGYMTFIPSIKSSFIFSNFNGTSGDVDVLTHEFGHSLEGFLSADIKVPSYRMPGMECCEIHSMSMEFFAYPWMKLFFKDQDEKYRFSHLSSSITFIPYGVSVDEFQHYVYENPSVTHEQRKAKWREIEKKYLPHIEYGEENPFLESGAFWMKQSHIYQNPFYYIDYTIAQVCAFEFFCESLKDYKKSFAKYIDFDKLGGLYPYKELLTKGGIKDPMVDGTIQELTPILEQYLASIDDLKY